MASASRGTGPRPSGPTAVHQVLATFHHGDAMGNEALAIRALFRRAGFASDIFAEKTDARMLRETRSMREYRQIASPDTVCLFHFSLGAMTQDVVFHTPSRLVLVYHNVTPPHFFLGFDDSLTALCHHARRLLAAFVPRVELGLAKSEFSRRELVEIGFAQTAVLPVVLDLACYRRRPAPVVLRLFRDRRVNILFVGRLVPNKKIDDLIRTFAVFRRRFDRRSRLLLVGDDQGQDRYLRYLDALARSLGVAEDVHFAGHVDQDELTAYYTLADVFLCLSEHEGFCVPLLEAMTFGVPVVAFDAGAVAETLGGAGVLLRDKHPSAVAEVIGRLLSDAACRDAVRERQKQAVEKLRATDYGALVLTRLAPVIGRHTP